MVTPVGSGSHAWERASSLIAQLLVAVGEFKRVGTLAEALQADLGSIASAMDLTSELDAIPIRALTGGRRPADKLIADIVTMLESLTARDHLILEERLYCSNPRTLQDIAEELGVSRERIRQLANRLIQRIETTILPTVRAIAGLLRLRIGPVAIQQEYDQDIRLVSLGYAEPVAGLAVRMIAKELGYSCAHGICLDNEAQVVVEQLRSDAKALADEVGLIDETKLRSLLPEEDWDRYWACLLPRCELHRIGKWLALRPTGRARVKAALLDLGRVATKEEIVAMSGLAPKQVSGQLSVMNTVVRADKTRWGLADWVDDVYEGTPAEIIQRINEDGGATSLDRLLEELPRQFGISIASVMAYVRTPQFLIQDGYVSMADESSIVLRDLYDVIHGYTASGDPYWTFGVEKLYFDGYSLMAFPPELARELGCEPNSSIKVRVTHPEGCGKVSVHWRLTSPNGPSLGYLAGPLKKLGVSRGDRVQLVIKGREVCELRRDSVSDATSAGSLTPSGDALLERIKNRRRGV